MESRHPYQVIGAVVVAMSFSFAAGAVGASGRTADNVKAEKLLADILSTSPTEYFPGRYQNQASEVEPLPPQF